jgi:YVTN family beta-propeller protein
MRWCKLTAALLAALLVWGCGGGGQQQATITVSVAPATVTLAFGASQQFVAFVVGTENDDVKWFVNDVEGGNQSVGLITTDGVYTAPTAIPATNPVTIKAVSVERSTASGTAQATIESGIRITVSPGVATIGTQETLQFTATVTGTSTTTVTWKVNDVDGGNATIGTIDGNGLYTAPTTAPTPASVIIRAKSTVDPAKEGTATLEIVAAADPVLSSLSPTSLALGALVQDLFLVGENFLSTNVVRINGVAVPASRIRLINRTLMRVRLPASAVSVPGSYELDVVSQGGAESEGRMFEILPARPALVGFAPDSARAGDATFDVSINGGFFGTNATPTVVAEFKGQAVLTTVDDARTIRGTISQASLNQAGLFPLAVRNTTATAQLAAVNLAVQPNSVASPTATIAVGNQPAAVAINTATGVAVVTNRADDTVSLINLATQAVATVAVGDEPVGVAVDNERNMAIVVNSGDKTISVINLATGTVVATVAVPPLGAGGTAPTPHAVGINPLTGLALVAHRTTNFASIFDLDAGAFIGAVGGTETVTVSTGEQPAVIVEPKLDWALVTPGGAGALTFVDLSRQRVLATATIGTSVRGIGINSETARAVLTDPFSVNLRIFSLLDQSVVNLALEFGHVAAAANPLTDMAVTVNANTNLASVIDLRTPARVGTVAVGSEPRAVAIDPGTNRAVVVNEGSDNVTLIDLGAIRALHVLQVNPSTTFTSDADLAIRIIGNGFTAASVVRLDESELATTFIDSRRLEATVPAALLSRARRFALDVVAPGPEQSNVAEFAVLQAIEVGDAPRAVAIDPKLNIALVANNGSEDVSRIDLATGTVTETIEIGGRLEAVAVLSRAGRALVSSRTTNSVSIIDLANNTVAANLFVSAQPIGVAVDEETGVGVVVGNAGNSFTFIDLENKTVTSATNTDLAPIAAAIDPVRGLVAIANAGQNTVTIYSLGSASPTLVQRVTAFQLPTGILFDPVSDRFIVVSSLTNNIGLIDPATFQLSVVRVGINPTAAAYNPNTGTLVTVNAASRTLSVMDFVARRVRAVYGFEASERFSVAIHPITNLAVIADEANDRVILFPLPR